MSLLVVGLSHRSAPVSVLERAALNADTQAKLVQDTLAAEPEKSHSSAGLSQRTLGERGLSGRRRDRDV